MAPIRRLPGAKRPARNKAVDRKHVLLCSWRTTTSSPPSTSSGGVYLKESLEPAIARDDRMEYFVQPIDL